MINFGKIRKVKTVVGMSVGMLFLTSLLQAVDENMNGNINSKNLKFNNKSNINNQSNLSSFIGFADSKIILVPDDYEIIQEVIEAALNVNCYRR